ncbi:uncharacterized protein STEHIDRAFT_67813, partial [Stereum hirsutum FP-91666 SS1]|uniref:uncharacterized protein n=1 Tax=Stereum hirsutum (strain FP-91666) TaxID=721885 RepID=UPI00044491FA
ATSTAVERVFSQGRHLLHFTRSRLSGKSIRVFMCLGAWNRADLITVEDQMPLDKGKGKRKYVEVDTIDLTGDDGDLSQK